MKIHGAPQGVTAYNSPAEWPKVSLQQHWKGTGSTPNPDGPIMPNIAHTHIEGKFPIWAELGAGPITVPFTLLLFNTTGVISDVFGQFAGPYGFAPFTECVVDQPLPMRGVPGGVVTLTGHVTFDPAKAFVLDDKNKPTTQLAIPKHGWFNTRIFARTHYDNGDQVDLEHWITYFSVLDPSVPEPPTNAEGTMSFVSKASVGGPNVENGGFGLQLTEFTGSTSIAQGFLPILAPFNTKQTVYPQGYNYKALPDSFKQHYEVRLDPDFHMGVEGLVIDSTEIQQANGNHTGAFVAVLDPAVIAASPAPMGVTPGKHRLAFMWSVDTMDGTPTYGPNQRLVTLVAVEVEVGKNSLPTSVPVPNVIGLNQAAAHNVLAAAGLMAMGTLTSDSMVPANNVISQSPVAGILVNVGSLVNLVVSTGPVVVNPPAEEWVDTEVSFMQLFVNGVAQNRWQICDPKAEMTGDNCPEIVTKK